MADQTDHSIPVGESETLTAGAASELNNLLQIISHTSSLLEKASGAQADEYRAILRQTIIRAEQAAAALSREAGAARKASGALEGDAGRSIRTKDAAPSRKGVLVVDDEKTGLMLMKRVLTEAGFDVAVATSGFEALDVFRQRPFQFELVLLDLTMPFMDGEETFSRLRDIRADLPVVLCTGFIRQERLERLRNVGLAGLLRKPIGAEELVNFVRSTLARLRYSTGSSASPVSIAI